MARWYDKQSAENHKHKLNIYRCLTAMIMTNRQHNINRFYNLLEEVLKKNPKRTLNTISRKNLPEQGVYFFFEPNETRQNGNLLRVVRIGTHAAIANSNASLYDRLYNHKGSKNLTGNHRGSVFRKLIGYSLIYRDNLFFPYWGDKSKKGDLIVKLSEKDLEIRVSTLLHTLPFTVIEVPGLPSKVNDRAFIEENSIGLLSNFNRPAIDKPSKNWLGYYSQDNKVIGSGLWCSKCVERQEIDHKFFDIFEQYLGKMNNWC